MFKNRFSNEFTPILNRNIITILASLVVEKLSRISDIRRYHFPLYQILDHVDIIEFTYHLIGTVMLCFKLVTAARRHDVKYIQVDGKSVKLGSCSAIWCESSRD